MTGLIKFQTDRGLDKQTYDALNEHANIIEEVLESVGLDVPKAKRPKLRGAITMFVQSLTQYNIVKPLEAPVKNTATVDAYADIITFCVGAILKLGYDPLIVVEECGKEINSRVGEMVDGKFEKDLSDEAKANWYKADYSLAERVSNGNN